MSVGPIQVIVFGFARDDQMRGEALAELLHLRGRGVIRLIDAFMARKRLDGQVEAVEIEGLSDEESADFGRVLGKFLGVDQVAVGEVMAAAAERTLAAAAASLGLDYQSLRQTVEDLQPGTAFAVLMFEHTWAIPFTQAIRNAGGVPLAQGFVTPESLMMVGEELNAITDAIDTIEAARLAQTVAILDTLATLEEAEAIKTAIAADVMRTLVAAALIEEAAINEAIETLVAAELLEETYLDKSKS